MARKEFETLTPQMFYILLALKDPKHGYDIMKEISLLSNDTVQVGAGTLYALIPRFLEDGYIRLVKEEDRRKVYQITDRGKRKMKEETEKLQKMISVYQEVFDHEEV